MTNSILKCIADRMHADPAVIRAMSEAQTKAKMLASWNTCRIAMGRNPHFENAQCAVDAILEYLAKARGDQCKQVYLAGSVGARLLAKRIGNPIVCVTPTSEAKRKAYLLQMDRDLKMWADPEFQKLVAQNERNEELAGQKRARQDRLDQAAVIRFERERG